MDLFAQKTISQILSEYEAGQHALKRTLGPASLVALGIGAIIGAGLFSLTGVAAAQNAGPAIALSMIVAAAGCAFAGLCYSEFSCMIPVAGSAYTYAYATLGEWIAWIVGWDLVLEYAMGSATVSISWSGYVVSLLRDFGIELPAELVAGPFETLVLPDGRALHGMINLPALVVIVAISLLLMLGIKESARANAVIVIIKLAVVLVFIGLGGLYIHRSNYTPFIPPNQGQFGHFGLSGIMAGAGTIFFAYIGFDAVSTAAQEARNPQRDMPIGIIGSLAVCTVLYVLFSIVLTGVVNYTKLGVAAPVAVAVDQTPYGWLRELVKVGIICGFTSVILVLLLGQSRVFFSMSRGRVNLKGLLRYSPAVSHSLAFESPIYARRSPIFCVFASICCGAYDQHRNVVRFRDRVRRSLDHAAEEPRSIPSLPDGLGASRSCFGDSGQLLDDVFARSNELAAFDHLACHRPGDLLWVWASS